VLDRRSFRARTLGNVFRNVLGALSGRARHAWIRIFYSVLGVSVFRRVRVGTGLGSVLGALSERARWGYMFRSVLGALSERAR